MTQFTTPVGRLVSGSTSKPNTKDGEGKDLVVKSGPNIGQPRVDYYLALAIQKTDPAWPAFLQKIQETAHAGFPHLFPNGPQGPCNLATFAFKYYDGDGMDGNGKPNASKAGHAGCWIVRLSSGYAPTCYNAQRQPITPEEIQRGYFLSVSGTMAGNKSTQRPGIYLNHNMVLMVGYGEIISSGPTVDEAFGSEPVALPAGASATPVTPVGEVPAAATPPSNDMPDEPAPLPPAPSAAQAVPVLTATPKVPVGQTLDTMKAAGWSDEQLISNGYALRT